MIRLNVLYPNIEGGRFDMAYYCREHIPMVRRRLGTACKGVTVEHGLGGEQPGSKPRYIAMAHLLFDSVEAFQAAFVPHDKAITDDLPNYTDIEPVVQISEVKL